MLLLVHIWILVAQRSMMATLILSVVAYNVMFAEKRDSVFSFYSPRCPDWNLDRRGEAFDHLSKLDPETDGVRFKSYMIAWDSIQDHPLFGFGQQSNSTLTEQKIFWYKFFFGGFGDYWNYI